MTPLGIPAAPGKPTVLALDGGVEITVNAAAVDGVEGFRYECSSDGGATWSQTLDVASPELTTTRISDLSNGTEYVCRTFASNTVGLSDPSPLSDVVRPCAGLFGCNPIALPLLSALVAIAAVGILVLLFLIYRDRTQGYVLAVLDVVHTANLGKGTTLGIELTRAPGTKSITGIVSRRGSTADFQIRALGGNRFAVTDKVRRQEVSSGESLIVVDSIGIKHELTLRAFDTRAASAVARGR